MARHGLAHGWGYRIGFSYPRIVSTGGDITVANQWLEQRHWSMLHEAYSCAESAYPSFGWNETDNNSPDYFAGYDYVLVEVTMVTPFMLSWTEEGVTGCGNTPPQNYWRFLTLDLETARPLDMRLIFKGWVPEPDGDVETTLEIARSAPERFVWGPDEELFDFVRRHRRPHSDPRLEAKCDWDRLIRHHLAFGFRQSREVRFVLDRLPSVMQACAYELYSAPIDQLKPLLAHTATRYFYGL